MAAPRRTAPQADDGPSPQPVAAASGLIATGDISYCSPDTGERVTISAGDSVPPVLASDDDALQALIQSGALTPSA